MKMIDLKKHPDAINAVKKEVCIQKSLQNTNILRFFGKRTQDDIEYIFLEYAAGGELFDRIGKLYFPLSQHSVKLIVYLSYWQNLTSEWHSITLNDTSCN